MELTLAILSKEIDRTLALIGRPRLSELDRSALRMDLLPSTPEPRPALRVLDGAA